MSDALAQAEALIEQGDLGAALKTLDRARSEALAGDDLAALSHVLALAERVSGQAAGEQDEAAARGRTQSRPSSPPQNESDAVKYAAELAAGRRVRGVLCLGNNGQHTACEVTFPDGTCHVWLPIRKAGRFTALRDRRTICKFSG